MVSSTRPYFSLSTVGRNILNVAGYEPTGLFFLYFLGEVLDQEEQELNNIGVYSWGFIGRMWFVFLPFVYAVFIACLIELKGRRYL